MSDEVRRAEILQRAGRPKLTGRIVSETSESILMECRGCLVEIPPGHIVSRRSSDAGVECALTDDATVVVSLRVLPQRRIIGDNVFGALIADGLLANNCNCNCNCGGGDCNCNCNCNCTECSQCSIARTAEVAQRNRFRVRPGG